MSCSKQDLNCARNQLLDKALQYFLSKPEVKAIFIAGSLAARTTNEFSDIDLRIVVAPKHHLQLVSERLAAPRQWGDFLYNEWIKDAIHCVSHFKRLCCKNWMRSGKSSICVYSLKPALPRL